MEVTKIEKESQMKALLEHEQLHQFLKTEETKRMESFLKDQRSVHKLIRELTQRKQEAEAKTARAQLRLKEVR